jgi:hypothetical protein
MTLQSEHKGPRLADTLPLQLALVAVVTFILVVMAWKYVW